MLKQPTWYEEPRSISIPVDEEVMKWSPLGNELSVYFLVGENQYNVVVPAEVWNESESTIPALAVGETQGEVIFSFPATSLGTYILRIPKSLVETIPCWETGQD